MQAVSALLGIVAILAFPASTWKEFGNPRLSPRVVSAIVVFGVAMIWQAHRLGPDWLILPSYISLAIGAIIAFMRFTTSKVGRAPQGVVVRYLTNIVAKVTYDEVQLYVSSAGYVGIASNQLQPHNRYYSVTDACPYCTVELVLRGLGVDASEYGSYVRRASSKQAVLRKRSEGYRLTYVDPKANATFFTPSCVTHAS